jgi:lysozyme
MSDEELDNLEQRLMQGDPQSSLPPDLRQDEGMRFTSYDDTEGNRTVGVGFNMDSPHAKSVWKKTGMPQDFDDVYSGKARLTEQDAMRLAGASHRIAVEDARSLVPNFDDLSDKRKAALVNLSYQLGKPRLSEFGDTLAAIKNGNYLVAAKRLLKTKYAKQTPQRARRIAAAIAAG